jgi:hypothetical protein
MPFELIAFAKAILESTKFASDVFKAWKQHSTGRAQEEGIRKLYQALCATTDYIEITKDLTNNRDREIERRLDHLWRDAAESIRSIDGMLADRLYLKAEYWRNPDRVVDSPIAQAQLAEAKITLRDIRNEMLRFL